MSAISSRYEFVYLFDVINGNPNGDPDAGNLPRLDPETNQGLVTDVCLKRKVRDFVDLLEKEDCRIFIQRRRPLNPRIAEAVEAEKLPTYAKSGGGWDTQKSKSRRASEVETIQRRLCRHFYDIRAFGAVMSTGPNAGQIRGPVQLAFARSIDPVVPLEQAITRVTDVDKEEGEMGRKHIIPYGLYRAHGFVSAKLAERTGFSGDDLELLWYALQNMLDHDRSAARGEMAARRLIVFRHASALGNAPAHKLFELVTVERKEPDAAAPARSYADYRVETRTPPDGVEMLELIQ